jgi:uncharacterized OB-fold protein
MPESGFTNASFREHLAKKQLMGTRCQSCGAVHVPPRPLCPACLSTTLEWVPFSGRGRLATFTVIHVAPSSMIAAGYGRERPYCSGIVELDEGPRVCAQILGVDVRQPESIKIGLPMRVAFTERGEGEKRRTELAFEPEAGTCPK